MTDNVARYGFRFYRNAAGGLHHPSPQPFWIPTGTSFDVNGGAQNVGLGKGDLVTLLATGGVDLADGSEGAAGMVAPIGVVVGVGPYWDGSKMVQSDVIPSDTAWGTIQDRISRVWVVPVGDAIWEVDVDDIVTATTKAAYQALIGENADMVNTGVVSVDTRAKPKLDIATHAAATTTLGWRIWDVSPTAENVDFAGANVKLLVRVNVAQHPAHTQAGI
jgi:hypothetical protein